MFTITQCLVSQEFICSMRTDCIVHTFGGSFHCRSIQFYSAVELLLGYHKLCAYTNSNLFHLSYIHSFIITIVHYLMCLVCFQSQVFRTIQVVVVQLFCVLLLRHHSSEVDLYVVMISFTHQSYSYLQSIPPFIHSL